MRMHPTSDLFFSDPILQSAFLVTNGKRKRRIRGQAWHAKLFSCELLSSSQPSTAARSFLPCFAARDFFFFFSLSLSQKVFISSLFSQVFFFSSWCPRNGGRGRICMSLHRQASWPVRTQEYSPEAHGRPPSSPQIAGLKEGRTGN